MKTFQKFDDITTDQRDEWARKYKNIHLVTVPTEDGEANFVVVAPSRKVSALIAKKADDPYTIMDIVQKNCILGGDMAYLDEETGDESIFEAVFEAVFNLRKKREAVIKNF